MIYNLYGIEYNVVPNNSLEMVETLHMLALQEGEIQLNKYGLNDWGIAFLQLEHRIHGICNFNIKVIAINTTSFYMLEYGDIIDIILHEVAHALVGPEHGHDLFWKVKARSMGCDGEQYRPVKKIQKLDEDKYKIIF